MNPPSSEQWVQLGNIELFLPVRVFQVNYGFCNDHRTKKKTDSISVGDCKCLFEDVPIPLKKEREKPPFSFFHPKLMI